MRKKKKGGDDPKKPIYVTDPNDPRYKAYQDSLTSYNNDQLQNKAIRDLPFNLDAMQLLEAQSLIEEKYPINRKIGKQRPDVLLKNFMPQPGRRVTNIYDVEFKKPVQEVVLTKNKDKPKNTSSTLYVTDPNDPRYKAYQDSLALYNNNPITRKFYKGLSNKEFGIDDSPNYVNSAIRPIGYDASVNDGSVIYDAAYKKPVQPVELVPQNQRLVTKLIPKRPNVRVANLQDVTSLLRAPEKPAVEIPLPGHTTQDTRFQDGVFKQDFKGVPGVQVWSKRDKASGTLMPVALVNSAGESIDYNKYKEGNFPVGFQHPRKMETGGLVTSDMEKYEVGGVASGPCPDGYYRPSKDNPCIPTSDTIANMKEDERNKWKGKLKEYVRTNAIDQKEYNKILGIEVDYSDKPGDIVWRNGYPRTIGPDGKLLPTPGDIRKQQEKEAKKAARNQNLTDVTKPVSAAPREELRLTPIQYNEFPKEGQNEYLKSLPKEERLAFIQEVDKLEQGQVAAAQPTGGVTQPLPNRPISPVSPSPTQETGKEKAERELRENVFSGTKRLFSDPNERGTTRAEGPSVNKGPIYDPKTDPYYQWLQKKNPGWTDEQLKEETHNYKWEQLNPSEASKETKQLADEYRKTKGQIPESQRDQTPVTPVAPVAPIQQSSPPPVTPQPPASPVSPVTPVTPVQQTPQAPIDPTTPIPSLGIKPVDGIDRALIPPDVTQFSREKIDPIAPVQPLPIKGVSPTNPTDPAAGMDDIKPSRDTIAQVQDEQLRGNMNKLKDRMTSLGSVTSAFVDMANMSNPAQTEIAPSAIAGGVSGFLSGGPIGALIGATTGALKAGTQRENYEQQEAERERTKFKGLRVAPSIMEKGGLIQEEALEEIPVQEEVGEVMFFPDGKLVDSMATKKHKEMKGKDKDIPTDIIPNGTMIFSDSKKRMINLDKIKDDIFNITKGHYSEDGNTKGEVIRMGDIYGTGEATPAELAKKVRKMTPLIEEPIEQIEVDTNKENLRRRAELLLPIMQMQEGVYKKFEYEKPMKFETGGMVKKKKVVVPKYEQGAAAVTYNCEPGYYRPTPESPCIPTDDLLSKLSPEDRAIKQKEIETVFGRINDAIPTPKLEPDMNRPQVGYINEFRAIKPGDTTNTYGENGTIAPTPTSNEIAPTTPASLDIKLPQIDDKVFGKIDDMLTDQIHQTEEDYNSSVARADSAYRSTRFRNFGILMSKLGSDGLQNAEVTPEVLGTEHVDSMFPKVTESQIQAQVNPVRQGQNRVLSMINDSGISGANVGSAIASTQARLIDNEGEVRNKANTINQSQEAKRFERLKNIIDLNMSSRVAAENDTRSNRNKLTADIGTTAADSIKAGGELQIALNERLDELKRWRQENKNAITDSEFRVLVEKEKLKTDRAYKAKMASDLAEIVQQFRVG